MADIWTAIAVMMFIAAVTALLTGTLAYSTVGQRTMLFLACSVLAAIYFLLYGAGQLFWAKIIPASAAIIYTNFAAIFAAMAAGWAWRLPKTPRWRRAVMAACLSMMSLAAIGWPLLSIAVRPPPTGGEDWEAGVAMQTSWATCSPAAGATLFRAIGIEVSESEMIRNCLTDSAGTPTLGLYRGIKLIADREGRTVEVLSGSTADLLEDNRWPVLLAVELPFGAEDRRYAEQWGWIPGMGHSVVALGRLPNGGIIVGDPSAGLEAWSEADLHVLWHGNGMRVSGD